MGFSDDLDACGVSAGFVRAGEDVLVVDAMRVRGTTVGVARGLVVVRELVGVLDIETTADW